MNSLSELMKSLNGYFGWNKARLYCFAGMLLALISVRSVNLREMAVAFASQALLDSRYRRLRRFFAYFKVDYTLIARWIFNLYVQGEDKVYLTIDRTNWYWGKSKINVLTLGIAHEGVAIPLFWRALNKAGNANAQEHQEIIERFVQLFGKAVIAGILADREFASGELFKWFNQERIPFYIRIKDNAKIRKLHESNRKTLCAYYFFRHLNANQMQAVTDKIDLFGLPLYIAGSRSERGELMVVATNQVPDNAIAIYLRRWEIECLFSCLKERGFNFEDTRLTHQDRIEKLMALLAMATAWVHRIGEWRDQIRPIKLKKFKNGQQRPQYSYFRYGLDFIREALIQNCNKTRRFQQCLKLITPSLNQLQSAS